MSEEREVEDEGVFAAAGAVVVFAGGEGDETRGAPGKGVAAAGRDEGAPVVADDGRGVKGAAPLLM